MKTPNTKCAYCDTPIYRYPYQLRSQVRAYCSRACMSRHYCTPVYVRLLQNIDYVSSPDGCWLWKGPILKTGYGRICSKRKNFSTHRVSYEYHHGIIPFGMNVLHKCDVRHCVNPKHLFLGTHQDNMDDCVAKGRTTHGRNHPNARLTEGDIRAIRELSASMSQKQLAAQFGVHFTTVGQILRGQTWTHVK